MARALPAAFTLDKPDAATVTGTPVLFRWNPSTSLAGEVRYLLRLWQDSARPRIAYEAPLQTAPVLLLDRERVLHLHHRTGHHRSRPAPVGHQHRRVAINAGHRTALAYGVAKRGSGVADGGDTGAPRG